MNILLITIACIIIQLCSGEEKCGECMSNEAYCIDETSYHFCMKGQPLKDKKYSCDKDHVCTGDERICVPESEEDVTAICSSSCNKCLPGSRYTCVSRTQYGRCVNNKITLIGECDSQFNL
ncbi:hypothetical protein DOY81_011476 [Sarcophaga bullata]|nr:hypothetical protein DOY81_011476 [Sarcophaga bullata]